MSVWTDLSVKVEEGSKIVADKARELSQIASIRAQIVGCDNVMYKNYRELGKAYYEAHKDDVAPEYAEVMNIIADSLAKKEDLLAQLAEIKKSTDVTEEEFEDYNEVAVSTSEAVEEAFDEADEIVDDLDSNLFEEEE